MKSDTSPSVSRPWLSGFRPGVHWLLPAVAMILASCGSLSATSDILAELGGEPCPDSVFTCVTLEVPVDHFNPDDDRTMAVTFAVLPASGVSRGAFVTAVGGPGASGVWESDMRFEGFGPEIRDSFDILFFDQRGVDLWDEFACPETDESSVDNWSELPVDLPERWEPLAAVTSTYLEECLAEMERNDLLPFLGTAQAAADLEAFRTTMGYPNIVLYGESYGTHFARVFADAYPNSVERLILDGTMDLTIDTLEEAQLEIDTLGALLGSVFAACDGDIDCAADMGMPAGTAYGQLLTLLEREPLTVSFPTGDGANEEITLASDEVGHLAFSALYGEGRRMFFLRALAAYAGHNDPIPLVRLNEIDYWSDMSWAVFQSVKCMDSVLPGETPEEELAEILSKAEAVEPNHRWRYESALICVFWPGVDHTLGPPAPFVGKGLPTLVIATEADPTTPYASGLEVYQHLDDGHLIKVSGGSHIMFGRGSTCINDAVTAFVMNGTDPDRVTCHEDLISDYVPLIPESLDGYTTADILLMADDEVYYLPEHFAWDEFEDLTVGCTGGGSVVFIPIVEGTRYELDNCAITDTIQISGTGHWDHFNRTSTMEVSLGGACRYDYRQDWDSGAQSLDENCG